MSAKTKEKKPLRLFHLPWQIFLIITVVVLIATFLGVLPKGMAGCFIFMIVVGDILAWIGDHTPIIKSYLGGGAIVVIFGSALLVYFGLIPAFKAPSASFALPKETKAAVEMVDKAVDHIMLVELDKDIRDKKVEAGQEYEYTYSYPETTDENKPGQVTVTLKVAVEENKNKETVGKISAMKVEPNDAIQNIAEDKEKGIAADNVRDYITSDTFTGYYLKKSKSADKNDPIGKTLTAVNSAVSSILKDTASSKRVAGKVYTAVIKGYGDKPVTVQVKFDESKAISEITVLPQDAPEEVTRYLAGEFNGLPTGDYTKKFIGQKGWNMFLPFGDLDLLGNIGTFFKTTGGFLDWYIAALITGSILGMNRKLLIKAAARYFPAIFGGLILAFGLCMGVASLMGYPVMNALLLIGLPIMGGGMGAGASPLSKIFEGSGSMSAAQALSVMTPAVAIGNAISIVLAGVLVKVLRGKLNGNGALMQAGSIDPKELEISPEMQQKRDHIELKNLGIGLLVSGAFFAIGYILQGCWDALGTGITVHAYAWMIITVAICKITNIVPENIEVACYQWFQFIMKNLTNVLLLGIGVCYLEIATVISSFSITYLLLCAATCIGAFVGAAFIGRLVGFYPFESGITAGLCMSNMGGTGDVAVLSAANRMELMPFAQISSRLGGAVILLLASLMLSILAQFLVPLA